MSRWRGREGETREGEKARGRDRGRPLSTISIPSTLTVCEVYGSRLPGSITNCKNTSCSDAIQNGDEGGIDCSCPPCNATTSVMPIPTLFEQCPIASLQRIQKIDISCANTSGSMVRDCLVSLWQSDSHGTRHTTIVPNRRASKPTIGVCARR